MSVNAQVLRLKKQLEDAERKQKESEKVLLHLVTYSTKADTLTRKSTTGDTIQREETVCPCSTR